MPSTKRKAVRKVTEKERSTHQDFIAPLAKWCESTLPQFDSLSSADIERFSDAVLEGVAISYHTIGARSQATFSALFRKIKTSLNSLSPPCHPTYSVSMHVLNQHIKEWEAKVNKAATTKIPRCLVQKIRIKRTILNTLNPVERGERTLKRPGTAQLVSTPKDVSNIFSFTLLTLGASLEYTQSTALVDKLLAHSPTCPQPTRHSPPPSPPDISSESFRNTLKRSGPNKAGRRDLTNNYTSLGAHF